MITLPKEFVATRYPGYFWNIKDEKLYSVKVTGMLKPLKFNKPNRWNHGHGGYEISVGGYRCHLYLDSLKKLKPKTSTFPVYPE